MEVAVGLCQQAGRLPACRKRHTGIPPANNHSAIGCWISIGFVAGHGGSRRFPAGFILAHSRK